MGPQFMASGEIKLLQEARKIIRQSQDIKRDTNHSKVKTGMKPMRDLKDTGINKKNIENFCAEKEFQPAQKFSFICASIWHNKKRSRYAGTKATFAVRTQGQFRLKTDKEKREKIV